MQRNRTSQNSARSGAPTSRQPANKGFGARPGGRRASLQPPAQPSTSRIVYQRPSMAGKPSQPRTSTAERPVPTKAAPQPRQLPAFSMPMRPPTMEEVQREKKKIIRRNKPAGEDLNELKEITRSIGETPINVHEFVCLVAPSTGDNGCLLRKVLDYELSTFRTTSRNIYETLTQDISEVLTNEHIQLKEFSEERFAVYEEKMQRCINEIFHLCPNFDFDKYYADPNYLAEMFPLAVEPTTEEHEANMRQEAYHRYQWLKSEGDRLKEENTRLQKRLTQLKRMQNDELRAVAERERRAEEERQLLQDKQTELEERLEKLNESVEKQLIESELVEAHAAHSSAAEKEAHDQTMQKTLHKEKHTKSDWAAQQAAEIEAIKASETLAAETSKISLRAKTSMSRTGAKRRLKRPPARKAPPAAQAGQPSPSTQAPERPASPFHYSPIKTPPATVHTRETSPFHYSPARTPSVVEIAGGRQQPSPSHYSPARSAPGTRPSASPFHYSPNRPAPGAESPMRTRMTKTTTITEQESSSHVDTDVRSHPGLPRRGRNLAPRDTWRGFQ